MKTGCVVNIWRPCRGGRDADNFHISIQSEFYYGAFLNHGLGAIKLSLDAHHQGHGNSTGLNYEADCILEGIHAGMTRNILDVSQLEVGEWLCAFNNDAGKYRIIDSGAVETVAENETLLAVKPRTPDFRIVLPSLGEQPDFYFQDREVACPLPWGWAASCSRGIYPDCDAFPENSFYLAHMSLFDMGMRARIFGEYPGWGSFIHISSDLDEFLKYVVTCKIKDRFEVFPWRSDLIDPSEETPLQSLEKAYYSPAYSPPPLKFNPFYVFSFRQEYRDGDHDVDFYSGRLEPLLFCVYGEQCVAGLIDYAFVLPLILKAYKPEWYRFSVPFLGRVSDSWAYNLLYNLSCIPRIAASIAAWLVLLPIVSAAHFYYKWEYNHEMKKIRSLQVTVPDCDTGEVRECLLSDAIPNLTNKKIQFSKAVVDRILRVQEHPPEIHLCEKKKPVRYSLFGERTQSPPGEDIVIPVNQENKKSIKAMWKTGAFFAGSNDRYMKEKIDEVYAYQAGL